MTILRSGIIKLLALFQNQLDRRTHITVIFEQIERKSSRNRVYDAIREAIFTGKLYPGQRLTETNLAQSFDVSRVVIREALQQLASDGFVVQNSYKGTHVVKLHSKEVNEILSVRLALETEAVKLAKANLTDENKIELREMIEKLEATTDPHTHVELDFGFHQRLWELSGNETLKRTLVHVCAPLFAMSVIIRDSKKFNKDSTEAKFGEHTRLIESILEGDMEEAVEAIRTHIERNRKTVGENFDKFLESMTDS